MRIKPEHILLLMLGFLIIASPTCSEPDPWENAYIQDDEQIIVDYNEVDRIRMDMVQSFEEEFEIEKLDEVKLNAFEARAIEKIRDFGEYVMIYTKKDYDTAFKDQAGKMIFDLFIDNNVLVDIDFSAGRSEDLTLFRFLEQLDSCEYDELNVLSHDFILDTPLNFSSDSLYEGAVNYSNKVFGVKSGDSLLIYSASNRVEIIVKKVNKKFGSRSSLIWKVFLCNIK